MSRRPLGRLGPVEVRLEHRALFAFDSGCLTCSRWARLIAYLDRRDMVRLATLESPAGQWLMEADPQARFRLFRMGRYYSDGAAIVEVLSLCRPLLGWVRFVRALAVLLADALISGWSQEILRRRAGREAARPCPPPSPHLARRLMWAKPAA